MKNLEYVLFNTKQNLKIQFGAHTLNMTSL